MRFVVLGAGAIGGAIGGRLAEHGHAVVLVARGAHASAMRADGLVVESPDRTVTVRPPIVTDIGEIEWREDDVVLIAVKTHDAPPVLDALRRRAPVDLPIVCAQNGLDNERSALRLFRHVHGMNVMCPATHLVPGVVQVSSAPISGVLDIGRYPDGVDEVDHAVAAALSSSGFDSVADADIMRWKRTKLLVNLGNAIEAICGTTADRAELYRRARSEGLACFAAAGLTVAGEEEERARRADLRLQPIAGSRRGGGSTWQSLTKGAGSTECDYLNGEVVLLGRLYGVPTPISHCGLPSR